MWRIDRRMLYAANEAAARLGGYQAALPLLVEFAASIRWRYVGSV